MKSITNNIKLVISLVFIAVAGSAWALDYDSLYRKRAELNLDVLISNGVGHNDDISKNLFGYNDLDVGIGFKYYFTRHWGAGIKAYWTDYHIRDSKRIHPGLTFDDSPYNEYVYQDIDDFLNPSEEAVEVLFDLNYRYVFTKCMLIPSFGVGFINFTIDNDDFSFYRKVIGSSQMDKITMSMENKASFVMAPGFEIRYYISRFVALGLKTSYQIINSHYNLTYEIKNAYTEENISTQKFKCTIPNRLQIGLSISVTM